MVNKRRKRGSTSPWIWGSIAVVVLLVVAIVAVALVGSSPTKQRLVFGAAPASVVYDMTHVPASVFNDVGVNSQEISVLPSNFSVKKGQPPLTMTDGKTTLPGAFYFGAEYCPYCAATRWGMILALLRFGSFPNWDWSMMYSSSTDYAPDTPTFTLLNAKYTSKYFVFRPYEVENREGQPIGHFPSNLQSLVNTYDSGQSFPFMDMGNKVFIQQSAFDPAALSAIHTQADIASQLDNPQNGVTQAVIATANYVSAGLCAIAKDPPASVCNSPGVLAADHALNLK